jgi:hypothetical protein
MSAWMSVEGVLTWTLSFFLSRVRSWSCAVIPEVTSITSAIKRKAFFIALRFVVGINNRAKL